MELRHQLVNSIDGPLKNDMYDVLGSNTITMSETDMLDVVEKLAVERIIEYVDYPTNVSKKNPVKLPPAQRSTDHSSPAHSSLAHSSPAHSSPAKFNPPAHAHALATLGLQREDQQVLAAEAQHILADNIPPRG